MPSFGSSMVKGQSRARPAVAASRVPSYVTLEDTIAIACVVLLVIAVRPRARSVSAHARNILHRDLKPGNVLLGAAGAKLLDFGIGKLAADPDATNTVAVTGTPLYISPELAEGQHLDARSDIFSFGAVLYEMLGGHRAFSTLGALLRDEPAPLHSPAASVVNKCLAKLPSQRFQSIAEVRVALVKVEAGKDQQPSIAVLPFAN